MINRVLDKINCNLLGHSNDSKLVCTKCYRVIARGLSWSYHGRNVTCTRCLDRLAKQDDISQFNAACKYVWDVRTNG